MAGDLLALLFFGALLNLRTPGNNNCNNLIIGTQHIRILLLNE